MNSGGEERPRRFTVKEEREKPPLVRMKEGPPLVRMKEGPPLVRMMEEEKSRRSW